MSYVNYMNWIVCVGGEEYWFLALLLGSDYA